MGPQSTKKETRFDLEHPKETFIEVKKSFAETFTLGSQEKPAEEMDPSMITTFLETYMKLFRDSKVVKGLQELINRCTSMDGAIGELCMVRKFGKHKARTRWEMRLTAQIGEY